MADAPKTPAPTPGDKAEKAVEVAGKLSAVVKDHQHQPNKFVEVISQLSEVITTHGMAPTILSCGIVFSFFALFRPEGKPAYAMYGGLGLGVVLILVGVLLHLWKTSREKPRTMAPPPPLDPQFVETLDLFRRIVAHHTTADRGEGPQADE